MFRCKTKEHGDLFSHVRLGGNVDWKVLLF